ncbi:hypothetical protein LLE49_14460 [Alicyclobacillus tolerans]|uniref:hypothetical protein n=1 Tax=Alicyclobacillus tolerans TaxID=90970 RepID=UPI001F3C4B7C|nr:hypothetical protein [Alicyclobacillus tolerans]MCF8565925.1 hypothetical protein [Alicyclobacillus tolerans]
MNVVLIAQTLLQRLPPVFIAGFVGAIVTRVYLQFLKEPSLRRFLSDQLWGSLIVFVLVTRFSGLILHPSILVRPNFYTLFGASAASGVALGVLAVIVYLLFSLGKANHLDRFQRSMWIARMSLVVSVVFYLYQFFLDLPPFWVEDLLRLALSFLILVILHTKWTFHLSHRLWGALAGFWLLTSLMVPHVNRIGPLDLGQWTAVLIVLTAIGLEALKDFRRPNNPTAQTSDRLDRDNEE